MTLTRSGMGAMIQIMRLFPIACLFDAVEPRVLKEALAVMQEACSGSNLRKLRENAKLTQSDLAAKVGLTQPALSLLESGTNRPPVGTALSLWLALTQGVCGMASPCREHYETLGDLESFERERAIEAAGRAMRAKTGGKGRMDLELAKARLRLAGA